MMMESAIHVLFCYDHLSTLGTAARAARCTKAAQLIQVAMITQSTMKRCTHISTKQHNTHRGTQLAINTANWYTPAHVIMSCT
jgi:hypothetical protein